MSSLVLRTAHHSCRTPLTCETLLISLQMGQQPRSSSNPSLEIGLEAVEVCVLESQIQHMAEPIHLRTAHEALRNSTWTRQHRGVLFFFENNICCTEFRMLTVSLCRALSYTTQARCHHESTEQQRLDASFFSTRSSSFKQRPCTTAAKTINFRVRWLPLERDH